MNTTRQILRGLAVALLALLAAPVFADQVIFPNGRAVTGTITAETEDSVTINDPLTGQQTFQKAGLTIRRGDAPPPDTAAAEKTKIAAKAQQTAGNYREALQILIDAAKQTPGNVPELAPMFQQIAWEVLPRAQEAQKQQKLQEAEVLYNALFNAMRQPEAKTLDPSSEKMLATVGPELSNVEYALGSSAAQDKNSWREAQRLFALAVEANPNNMNARAALGEMAYFNQEYPTARESYQAVVSAPDAPAQLKERAQAQLQQINQVAGVFGPGPTPAPARETLQPITQMTPYVGPPPPAAAPAAATPEPTPTGPKWKQFLHSITAHPIMTDAKGIGKEIMTGEHTAAIVAIIAFVLLFWVAPFQFLRYRANSGDVVAGQYRNLAKKVGIFALVPWAMRLSKAPRAKHKCPFCGKGIDNIDSYGDLNFVICPHCRENITPIYDMNDYVTHLIKQLESDQRRMKGTGAEAIEKDAMAKLVRAVLTLAVRRRASDLHVDPEAEGAKVRARIDGMMYELLPPLPRSVSPGFVSAVKIMANLNITEHRTPQDGKASVWIDKNDIDLRINTSPAAMGERLSMRVLNQRAILVEPTRLGLDGENLERFERAVHKPHGVVIVTGPSGSGKSTTLYVALNELNTGERNIITLEDPIEYQLKGLSQMQVNPAANFTFATGLRSILRQDPDVIMVGEIRDRETAEIAIEAAMTGHLVFTTLHTIDAPTAFTRLADLGIDVRRLSQSIICVLGQRLVRTICPDCRKPYKPKRQDLETLGIANSAKDFTFVHGTGCDSCLNTGYLGRIAIFEFIEPDDSLREVLESHATVSVIRELARKNGYRSLREEGVVKVMQGVTTVEEVIRVTS